MGTRHVIWLLVLWALVEGARAGAFSPCEKETRYCTGHYVGCDENTGKCACDPNYYGEPHLGCVKKTYKYCTILSDPKGRTFAEEPGKGVDLAFPCQFLAAEYESRGKFSNEKCGVQIFTSEQRFDGKLYIYGFMADINWKGSAAMNVAVRARGSGSGGQYKYKLERRDGRGGWRSRPVGWVSLGAAGMGRSFFTVDAKSNRVILKVEKCGLIVIFRPADSKLKVMDQVLMPGLIVAVNEMTHHIKYDKFNRAFCMSSSPGIADVTERLGMSNEDSFLFRGFAANSPQVFPELARSQCAAVSHSLSQCHQHDNHHTAKYAVEECSFIFLEPHFLNCFGRKPNSEDLIQLFHQCVNSYCHMKVADCQDAQSEIASRGCSVYAGMGFRGYNCSSLAVMRKD